MTDNNDSSVPFETALAELENLVGQLEHGDLTLEESLVRFERGIVLVQTCQNTLRQAEQKVDRLVERNGQWQAAPFEGSGGSNL